MKLMKKGKRWFALILMLALIAGYLPMTQVKAAECPVFNGSTDTNVAENATVYKYLNRTSTKAYADYATNGNKVVLAAQESGYFGNIKYGASNSYNYSAKITLGSGSSLSAINFVVAKMSHTDGIDRFIVVDVRVNGGGNWVHVAQTHDLTGGAIADGNFITAFGAIDSSKIDKGDLDYTVRYENGVISFWFEGTQVGSSIDLKGSDFSAKGLSNPVPFAGFDSTDYSGTISDVKIWGDVTNEVVFMPTFNESVHTDVAGNATVYKYLNRTSTKAYADYETNGNKVVLAAQEGGYFGNIKYGASNSYNYSAKIALGSGSSMSAINFVVAKMSHTDGIDRFITVDVRVNGGGNWVHVANTHDLTGGAIADDKFITAFGQIDSSKVDKGDLDYTVQYKNGVISFWFEGTQIGSSIDLKSDAFKKAGLSNPVPFAGFDSTDYSGTISDVKIWGDVTNEAVAMPVFDEGVDTNAAKHASVYKYISRTGTQEYADYATNGNKIVLASQEGGYFGDIRYGASNSYNYSAKIALGSGSSMSAINFVVAKMSHTDGIDRFITVDVRVNGGGNWVHVANTHDLTGAAIAEGNFITAFGQIDSSKVDKGDLDYTVQYKNGVISFWFEGTQIGSSIDLNGDAFKKAGLSNPVPFAGFDSTDYSGTISDIKIWGDVATEAQSKKPVFNETVDTNVAANATVYKYINRITTKEYSEYADNGKKIVLEAGEGGYFGGIEYGKSNSYNYSAKIALGSGSDMSAINFIVAKMSCTDGIERLITVDVRVNGGGNWVHAASTYDCSNTGAGELIKDFGTIDPSSIDKEDLDYTVQYSNGIITFWFEGEKIGSSIDLNGKEFKDKGITNPVPFAGFDSTNYTGTISDIKLWGDVTKEYVPVYDEATDINIADVATVYKYANRTSAVRYRDYTINGKKVVLAPKESGYFGHIIYGDSNSYNYSAKISLEDGSAYSAINFIVAKMECTDGIDRLISVDVRVNGGDYWVHASMDYDLTGENAGTLVETFGKLDPSTIDKKDLDYIVQYNNGKISFWFEGKRLGDVIDLNGKAFTSRDVSNPKPFAGFDSTNYAGTISDVKIWGDVSLDWEWERKVPQKPEGNGDYADTLRVTSTTVLDYTNGVLEYKTADTPGRFYFGNLPFQTDESYVLGFNINTKTADEIWKGGRFIFGRGESGEPYALWIMRDGVQLVGDGWIGGYGTYSMDLDTEYRIDMEIKPNEVSVWINNEVVINRCAVPERVSAQTGIWYECAAVTISDMDMYYIDAVEYKKPYMPEEPVLKTIAENQYNAADWMKAGGGYFDNKLLLNTLGSATYYFDNIPITDDMSYYYSATYKILEGPADWSGTRFIVRHADNGTPVYVGIFRNVVYVIAEQGGMSAPFHSEIGRDYNIVIYSTPKEISVWIDGETILKDVDVSQNTQKGQLQAKTGLWFENCRAEVRNIAIYGDKVKFNPDYVDAELYNNPYYRMKGIPQMPDNAKNLFENVVMWDGSDGSLGVEYDAKERKLTTRYDDGYGQIGFLDAAGSANLNGLKNGSNYVFRFKYKVEASGGEGSADWLDLNKSTVPGNGKMNVVRLGICETVLWLQVFQDDLMIQSVQMPFERVEGREYDIAVVHGKNWMKVYVDDVLSLAATDLPEYKVRFNFTLNATKSVFSDMTLYELDDNGLEIVEPVEEAFKANPEMTVYNAPTYSELTEESLLSKWLVLPAVVGVLCVAGIVFVVLQSSRRKKGKTEEQ